jgi:hypothetical protein
MKRSSNRCSAARSSNADAPASRALGLHDRDTGGQSGWQASPGGGKRGGFGPPTVLLAYQDLPSLPLHCPPLSYASRWPMLSQKGCATRALELQAPSLLAPELPTARSSCDRAAKIDLHALACRGLRGRSLLAHSSFGNIVTNKPTSFPRFRRSHSPKGPQARPPYQGLRLLRVQDR